MTILLLQQRDLYSTANVNRYNSIIMTIIITCPDSSKTLAPYESCTYLITSSTGWIPTDYLD